MLWPRADEGEGHVERNDRDKEEIAREQTAPGRRARRGQSSRLPQAEEQHASGDKDEEAMKRGAKLRES